MLFVCHFRFSVDTRRVKIFKQRGGVKKKVIQGVKKKKKQTFHPSSNSNAPEMTTHKDGLCPAHKHPRAAFIKQALCLTF